MRRPLRITGPGHVIRAAGNFLEVRAGTKRAIGTGQHSHVLVGVVLEIPERLAEPQRPRTVERVTDMRPIDRHDCKPILFLNENSAIGIAGVLCHSVLPSDRPAAVIDAGAAIGIVVLQVFRGAAGAQL